MSNNNCEKITECIACGHDKLTPVLNLREQPLANSFKKTQDEKEEIFPLAINHCDKCYHVQLTHKVNPDLLFKNYLYVSGTAKTQLEYFDWFANLAIEEFDTREAKVPATVFDIGCNDGSQLDAFRKRGLQTFGIDPAENLHKISSKKHHDVICGYFNEHVFASSKSFDIILCQNAFAHNYDQLGFLKKVRNLMHPFTKLYITTSQANMVQNNEFDTIYHEHLSFYNIKSMKELCRRAGLYLIDVVRHPIHGTTNIFIISRFVHKTSRIDALIEQERLQGLYDSRTYIKYAQRCEKIIKTFAEKINELREQGYMIAGYGASAKGNTFLNASLTKLDFIVDDNPLKQNMWTPGTTIPIYGQEVLEKYSDVTKICFVPLAWNFFEEIKEKIRTKRRNNLCVFLQYFPEVRLDGSVEETGV
jgi:2-polyprenyl-3-methyl-5-hydroxy-6-metoxy-1,4-benzoquinol methylase